MVMKNLFEMGEVDLQGFIVIKVNSIEESGFRCYLDNYF